MTAAEARIAPIHIGSRFASFHKWDRNAFLVLAGLIWLGIVMGFGPVILKHMQTGQSYPLVIHFHAAFFVGWLLLLTAQVLLIRVRRTDLHRKLGVAGAAMVPVMVGLGIMASIMTEQMNFGTRLGRPPFLAIEFTDMVAFAGLAGAALFLRTNSSAHKRLILLATFYVADAGFSRWLGRSVVGVMGRDFAGMFAALYLGTDLLALALGGYDLATPRRLHPAYVAGMAWLLAWQFAGVGLYRLPQWKPMALAIIGH